MKTAIAVIIDADGGHCGDRCWVEPMPRGGVRCHLFGQALEQRPRELGVAAPQDPPLRCAECLRAENRMRQATRQKGQSAPDIRRGDRAYWREVLAK